MSLFMRCFAAGLITGIVVSLVSLFSAIIVASCPPHAITFGMLVVIVVIGGAGICAVWMSVIEALVIDQFKTRRAKDELLSTDFEPMPLPGYEEPAEECGECPECNEAVAEKPNNETKLVEYLRIYRQHWWMDRDDPNNPLLECLEDRLNLLWTDMNDMERYHAELRRGALWKEGRP